MRGPPTLAMGDRPGASGRGADLRTPAIGWIQHDCPKRCRDGSQSSPNVTRRPVNRERQGRLETLVTNGPETGARLEPFYLNEPKGRLLQAKLISRFIKPHPLPEPRPAGAVNHPDGRGQGAFTDISGGKAHGESGLLINQEG